jgi:hypothetical protein
MRKILRFVCERGKGSGLDKILMDRDKDLPRPLKSGRA